MHGYVQEKKKTRTRTKNRNMRDYRDGKDNGDCPVFHRRAVVGGTGFDKPERHISDESITDKRKGKNAGPLFIGAVL